MSAIWLCTTTLVNNTTGILHVWWIQCLPSMLPSNSFSLLWCVKWVFLPVALTVICSSVTGPVRQMWHWCEKCLSQTKIWFQLEAQVGDHEEKTGFREKQTQAANPLKPFKKTILYKTKLRKSQFFKIQFKIQLNRIHSCSYCYCRVIEYGLKTFLLSIDSLYLHWHYVKAMISAKRFGFEPPHYLFVFCTNGCAPCYLIWPSS